VIYEHNKTVEVTPILREDVFKVDLPYVNKLGSF
jgi:hypothetical protein